MSSAGIVNVMRDVQEQTGQPPYAVFGGKCRTDSIDHHGLLATQELLVIHRNILRDLSTHILANYGITAVS